MGAGEAMLVASKADYQIETGECGTVGLTCGYT